MRFSPLRNSNSSTGNDEIYRKISDLQESFNEQKQKIDELDDPLTIFDTFYLQLNLLLQSSNLMEDSSKFIISVLVPALDSATQTFARDPRYRNDPRYLKLWLAYSKYCREAEDIFVFLAQEGIAQGLASYYEEYSSLLIEKRNYKEANLIYQKGIEKKAQPLERLKKKFSEFQSKYSFSIGSSSSKALEVRGYNSKLIHEGDFSFEEIRAKNWYSKPKISKPSLNEMLPKYRTSDLLPTIQNVENYANVVANRNSSNSIIHDLTSDHDDDDPGLGISVNPDDLTHINVFKDNTADLREIAKLVKSNNPQVSETEKILTPKKKTDWLLKDLLMSFSPIRKKPHVDSDTENTKTSVNNSPVSNKMVDIRLEPDTIPDIKTDVTMKIFDIPKAKEEVDYSNLMDPFDLDFRIAQCEAVLSQIASEIPNLNLKLNEMAGNKVKSFEKNLGRDGSGPNHTVSSLRIASGHFFMEKKLGEGGYGKVYLGVDLLMDDDDQVGMMDNNSTDSVNPSVNQVAIKIEMPSSVWESYIIFRIQSHILQCPQLNALDSRHFPKLISASIYSDVSFLVMDYYEQGSLLSALNVYRQKNTNIDEALILFYASELIKSVLILHQSGILHTDIKLENLLILTSKNSSNSSSTFNRNGLDGWSERGLVLIDFGRCIDLKLLKEEERTRFYIKSKHSSFNGSPRIIKNLDISHEMDWYGVADCLHWLLHQKPILLNNTYTKLLNPFKRYWQTDIWEPLFDDLLNPPRDIAKAISVFKSHLEGICVKLENWKRTPSLKSLLTRQEIMLYENKK